MKLDLSGEVAWVTGASRGIGQAIALAMGQAGAAVVGTATTEGGAAGIDAAFAQAGIRGFGMVLDVRDRDAVAPALKSIQERLGAPSVLVNNAGITRDNLMLLLKDEDWDQVLDTNLGAAFRLTRACARAMVKARRGRIINIGSVVGAAGNAGQANYAAAKAGLAGLTRALARELGSRSITVNTIAPGFIDTDMTRGLDDAQRTALLGGVPLGRFGTVDEVAAAAVFLASAAGAYITGQTLHVNGGMLLS